MYLKVLRLFVIWDLVKIKTYRTRQVLSDHRGMRITKPPCCFGYRMRKRLHALEVFPVIDKCLTG